MCRLTQHELIFPPSQVALEEWSLACALTWHCGRGLGSLLPSPVVSGLGLPVLRVLSAQLHKKYSFFDTVCLSCDPY